MLIPHAQELRVRTFDCFEASVICVSKDATPMLHAESMIRKLFSPWDCSYKMFVILLKSHASAILKRYSVPSEDSDAFSLFYFLESDHR